MSSNRLYGSIPRVPWRYPVQIALLRVAVRRPAGLHPGPYRDLLSRSAGPDDPRRRGGRELHRLRSPEGADLPEDAQTCPTTSCAPCSARRWTSRAGPPRAARPTRRQVAAARAAAGPRCPTWAITPGTRWRANQWVAAAALAAGGRGVGLLAWPLTAVVCRRLPDRGYPLAKSLALVLVAWLVWMAASLRLVPFTVWSIARRRWPARADQRLAVAAAGRPNCAPSCARSAWLVAGLGGAVPGRLRRLAAAAPARPRPLAALVTAARSRWSSASSTPSCAAPGCRRPTPSSPAATSTTIITASSWSPALIKLVGVPPSVGYNLALPAALRAAGAGRGAAWSTTAWRRCSGRAAGAPGQSHGVRLGPGGASRWSALAGNLHGGLQVFSMLCARSLPAGGGAVPAVGHDRAGDVARSSPASSTGRPAASSPRTINEFPYWIYLFGDLHAHLIGLPFTLLALGLALNVLLGAWRWDGGWGLGIGGWYVLLCICGAIRLLRRRYGGG